MEPRVKVLYRNEKGEVTSQREYALTDYVGIIQTDQFRVITEIENLYYRLNEGKPKREWARDDVYEFEHLKHKLLDKAGEIARIPASLIFENKPEDGVVAWTQLNGLNAQRELNA